MRSPMDLEALLGDEPLRRREFPVAEDSIFLAHAGVSPLPARSVAAMTDYLAQAARHDQEACFPAGRIAETRALAAALLCCAPEEVALLGPTSLGLSVVANGLDFPPRANVVCYRDDYPANVYPWRALTARGVEVRSVRAARLGAVTVEDVAAAVDGRTALVALASAHYLSGDRLDLAAIGGYLKARGILFCVDGIQTLGGMRTTVEDVDFLAADSHKWLLGPDGAGILYVRR